jgi:membrane protein DedA with SNARE-associated domain
MGLPIPGETALIAASLLSNQGKLELPIVIAVAATASIIGDNLGYMIGRRGGRKLLERPGRLHAHRLKLLESGDRFFAKYGAKAVFLARFFAGVRVTAAWMAGINHMEWKTFLTYNALGAIVWATVTACVVYTLGESAERILESAGLIGAIVFGVAALGVGIYLYRRHRRA